MDHRIRSAMERIHRRFDRRLAVPELAARVNLSPSRFSHLFRSETGVSPSLYLKRVRLRAARELLETSFLSVKEVMGRVGLNDASHFVRDFKQHHGVRPGHIRRRPERLEPRAQPEPPIDSTNGQRTTPWSPATAPIFER
jgi:AraC family transcriptional regulator of arabinose operon